MSGLEETLKSIADDNKQFREEAHSRFSKLFNVMKPGTNQDAFSDTVSEILGEVTQREGDEVLGDDGETESDDGSSGNAEDAVGG